MSVKDTEKVSSNDLNNSDDFHLQPKEDSPIRKEKGIPMWLIYVVLFIIAGIAVTRIYIWKSTPITERVYDYAVKEVENDLSIFSGSTFKFQEFDESYVTKKSDEIYDVDVAVCVNSANGLEKNYIYDVQIEVKNNVCKTIYCMRRMENE